MAKKKTPNNHLDIEAEWKNELGGTKWYKHTLVCNGTSNGESFTATTFLFATTHKEQLVIYSGFGENGLIADVASGMTNLGNEPYFPMEQYNNSLVFKSAGPTIAICLKKGTYDCEISQIISYTITAL